jgi:hypothetical protein
MTAKLRVADPSNGVAARVGGRGRRRRGIGREERFRNGLVSLHTAHSSKGTDVRVFCVCIKELY